MKTMRNSGPPRLVSPKTIERMPGFRAGYADAQAGLGFRLEYETAKKNWQVVYEYGRQAAAQDSARGPRQHVH